MNKRQLLKDIEEVREAILSGRERYVCIAAIGTKSGHHIVSMVEMHIGCAMGSMEGFLKRKFKLRKTDIAPEVARSYRVAMMNNMRDMVKNGVYRA